LALYDPENPRWADLGGKVAEALATVNSVDVRPWLEALRPVRGRLTAPLAVIFRDKNRSETVHSLTTNILAGHARDAPGLLAELLMAANSKAYRTLFPVAEQQAAQALTVFRAELVKKADPTWNDPPLAPSWTAPDSALVSRIESAQGLIAER